jgi:hypothetical protein
MPDAGRSDGGTKVSTTIVINAIQAAKRAIEVAEV